MRTKDLHIFKRFNGPLAWWRGDEVAYIDEEGLLHLGTRRLHADPVYIPDSHGRFFLGLTDSHRIWPAPGNVPECNLTLWELSTAGHLREVRHLYRTWLDTGSMFAPNRLEMLDALNGIYGYPAHLAAEDDLLGVMTHGRLCAPITDGKRHQLMFIHAPVRLGRTIFGLVKSVAVHVDYQPIAVYVYVLTSESFELMRLPRNAVLATYDPVRKQIGIGVRSAEGVRLCYLAGRRFE